MLQLTKQNLSIGAICSKTGIRPELTGLFIDPKAGTITATDSYRLITMPTGQTEEIININQQPAIIPDRQIILPATTAKIAKAKIKKSSLPDLESCYFLANNLIASTTLETAEMTNFMPIDGEFPDFESIVTGAEQAPAIVSININAKLLAELLKTMTEASGEHLTLKISDRNSAILITNRDKADGVKGLLMPELQK